MVKSQKYYEILDYTRPLWERIRGIDRPREQLKQSDFLSAQISCLVGEKGIGKTVLACQKALAFAEQDTARVLYISLDDTYYAGDTMYDLALLAEEYDARVIVFDEVHRYSDWKSDLKRISDRLKIRCIVTGSSILSFKDLGGLSRRLVKYELRGMSLREYLGLLYRIDFPSIDLEELVAGDRRTFVELKKHLEETIQKPIALLFNDYLRRGYYAYSLGPISDSDFRMTLRQATEDTIAYEIVLAQSHSRPDMARKLQAIFKAIAKNVPYTIDYEALKSYAHISDLRTLKHYLACLQDAGIIRSIDRLSLKSLRKPEKVYLGNPCLYHAYADLGPNLGSIRESYFLTSLSLANEDVLVYEKHADFRVGSYTFEVGGAKKGKAQIKGESSAFVIRDEWEMSADPQVLPLWLFGFLK